VLSGSTNLAADSIAGCCHLTNLIAIITLTVCFESFVSIAATFSRVLLYCTKLTKSSLNYEATRIKTIPRPLSTETRQKLTTNKLRGGGVCVLIKKSNCFSVCSVEIPDCYKDVEIVAVDIDDSSGVQPLRVVATYRPPTIGLDSPHTLIRLLLKLRCVLS